MCNCRISGNLLSSLFIYTRRGSDIEELSKEDKENDDVGSLVTLSTMGTYDSIDFLIPERLSLFSAALLEKSKKSFITNLPKSDNLSTETKKNYLVAVKTLIQGIKLLKKAAISENNSARSIHNTAKKGLKRGTKTLGDSAKKMNKLNDNLTKTNTKLTDATEKLRKATSKTVTAVSGKKTVMSNLATKASALKKVKKE